MPRKKKKVPESVTWRSTRTRNTRAGWLEASASPVAEAESEAKAFKNAVRLAAHVIVSMRSSLPVDSVTVVSETNGKVSQPSPFLLNYGTSNQDDARRKAARDLIIATYAGLEAQRLVDRHVEDQQVESDAWSLSREYGVLPPGCDHFGDDVHDRYMRRLRKKAATLARLLRPCIEPTAYELVRHGTMSGDEIEAYLNKTFPWLLAALRIEIDETKVFASSVP